MLDISEIRQLINKDITSEKKRFAAVGQRYYEGNHDIKDYRLFYYDADGELKEDTTRSNIKISHPFFTELVDQLVAYVLSDTDNIIKSDTEGLQEYLDRYFDEAFWSELADMLTGAYAKGFDYIYAYKNAEDRLAFQYADSMGVVEVREKDTDEGCEYIIYWYVDRIDKGKKVIKRIQVHSATETWYFVQSGNGKIILDNSKAVNPMPNVVWTDKASGKKYGDALGFMPYFRFDYNRKQISGLKPIKALIDDYDLMQCGLSNNIQDLVDGLFVVKGFAGDNMDELITNLKTKKAIGVTGEGGVDIRTVDIPHQARKVKADEDEKNIYRFGMGLNTQGLKDTSATTNLAIQAAYTLLDLKAGKVITRLKKFLKGIVKVVIDEINKTEGKGYQPSDVYFDFQPNMLVNETENIANEKIKAETKRMEIDTILAVAAYVGDEEALKEICDVLDVDYEEIKAQVEKADENKVDLTDAKKTLNNATVEGGVEE